MLKKQQTTLELNADNAFHVKGMLCMQHDRSNNTNSLCLMPKMNLFVYLLTAGKQMTAIQEENNFCKKNESFD